MPYTGQQASGWNTPAQDPKPAGEYSGTAAPTQLFGSGQGASGSSYQGQQSPQQPYTPQTPPAQQYGSSTSSPPAQQYGSIQGSAPSAYGGAPAAQPPANYGPPQGLPQPPAPGQQPSYGAQSGYPAPGAPAYGGPPPASRPTYQPAPYGGAPQGYPGQQGAPQGYAPGYPSAPPKKSKTPLFLAIGAVVLLAIIAVVLFLTLSTTVLDPAAVQRDVAAQFQDQEGVGIQLTCPTDMEVEVGATYECTGTTEDSEDVTLVIEVSDEDGNYTWQERL